ncbi:hypothetical protein TWF718_000003 [Orbilia javanica]|uniref:Uncharacterized protein n=1 Tax=Orbilia javanica TaxID=47235 RepID=A0AAN8MYZ2_9PEZI
MLVTKALLFSCLLWSYGIVAATVPERASVIKGPEVPTASAIPRHFRGRSINPKIKAGDINKYLHPNAKYTSEDIDCADGKPVLSEGLVIGCFFLNDEETMDRAVRTVAAAKNLTDPYIDESQAFGDTLPSASSANPLHKRGFWRTSTHACHESGVYSYINDLKETSRAVCAAIDALGGSFISTATWTITQMGTPSHPVNIVAAGDSSIRIRHDYMFYTTGRDTWVHSTIIGECNVYINMLFGLGGWPAFCIGGSRIDSRGGWLQRYDDTWPYRQYTIGADPNRINTANS